MLSQQLCQHTLAALRKVKAHLDATEAVVLAGKTTFEALRGANSAKRLKMGD